MGHGTGWLARGSELDWWLADGRHGDRGRLIGAGASDQMSFSAGRWLEELARGWSKRIGARGPARMRIGAGGPVGRGSGLGLRHQIGWIGAGGPCEPEWAAHGSELGDNFGSELGACSRRPDG